LLWLMQVCSTISHKRNRTTSGLIGAMFSTECGDMVPRLLPCHLTQKDYSSTLKRNEPLTHTRRCLYPSESRLNISTKGDS
jgi:hypothetical protein